MPTVVISLAMQTLRRSQTLEEFLEAFMKRVHALDASYTLLSNRNQTVSLAELPAEETKPYMAQDGRNIATVFLGCSGGPRCAIAGCGGADWPGRTSRPATRTAHPRRGHAAHRLALPSPDQWAG
jgi:hypothetical protein